DVVSIGQCTTPTVYFATATQGFDAAVMITASHNPPKYNGLKVCKTSALPVDYSTGLSDLEQMICKDMTPAEKRGTVSEMDVRGDYLDFLRQYLPDLSKLKIGVDCSNGMACLLIKELLGSRPQYIYDEIDGTFPNHPPNPLEEENCAELKELVKDNGLDIGLIFDGDADRVMFIDEQGRFVQPDLITAVLAEYFLESTQKKCSRFQKAGGTPAIRTAGVPPAQNNCTDGSGRVLHDIRTSKAVTERILELGGEPHMWKVGHSFAKMKMRELGCVVGGELAGHYYFRDFFNCDSGILTALIVLSVAAKLKERGKPFSACIDGLMRYANSGEINLHVEQKDEAIAALVKTCAEAEKPEAVYDFDGVRMEFPDWWFSVRSSNTEPYLRLLIEAKNEKLLAEKRVALEAALVPFI
ncbi:MAG: phosphomannomutase/phosphoglucomutase, partial [Kiritimatiellales bacterium]|nr:phosphomannomutase/phosphoglucomutase [Kiritimatiellales bacterium]